MPRTMVIHRPAELDGLSVLPGFRRRGLRRLRLDDAAQIDPERRRVHETRLNRFYFACGCDKAAMGMMLGLVCYAGWLAARGSGLLGLEWRDLWLGFAAMVAATMIGKLVGRLLAARAFRRAVGELKREWQTP